VPRSASCAARSARNEKLHNKEEKKMSWKRLKLWFTLHKGCKSCCLFCKHYTECAADIGAQTKE